jgi:ABC-2 type transport system ATP-binding protein
MSLIRIEDLVFGYSKDKNVLNKIQLEISRGTIFGLLGMNGAGKTTLIKNMIGMLKQQSGAIYLDGMRIDEDEIGYKKKFYYVPDEYDIYPHITGNEWIRFVTGLYDVPEGVVAERVACYAKEFEMENALNTMVGTYSLGMRNKLGIMLGFIIGPEILIMDEPLHGLDPFAIVTYKSLLREYVENGGTVFLSTHLLDLSQVLCSEVGILAGGKIVDRFSLDEYHEAGELEKHFMTVLKTKKAQGGNVYG